MYSKRKFFILTSLILVALASIVWWRSAGLPSPIPPSLKTGSDTSVKANPYLIDSMASRSYNSDIKVLQMYRETDRFTSFRISYQSDGLTLYALMNLPQGTPPTGGWPVVVVNHGHIPPHLFSTPNSYINTSAFFANAGYLVFKPDYRGHDDSEGVADKLVSRLEYAIDVRNLLAGIEKYPQAHKDRIYMYGHSMGGDVTLRVIETGGRVKAATLWAPAVTDFPEVAFYFARRNNPDNRLAKYQAELQALFKPEQYSAVSTLHNTNRIKIPINVHHGTADSSVPYSWGEALVQKLKESQVPVQFFTYQGDNHDIAGNWSTALNRDIQLFK